MTYFSLSREEWEKLFNVAAFQQPATTWIQAKRILNVYTGEIFPGNIALAGDRIAYVGEKVPKVDENTEVIDAGGLLLVPGYTEPHSHPFQVYNPVSFSEFSLRRGTTTLINDNLNFMFHLDVETFKKLMDQWFELPVKNFWWCRLDPQSNDPNLHKFFERDVIERLMKHPLVLQAGELTAWKPMIDGDKNLRDRMYAAWLTGKRIETHNPGSSVETLSAVAAAGVTGCHESITPEEVMRRIRLGLIATLRYSSIRPDLPELIRGLVQEPAMNWDRVMLTTDASSPFFHKNGTVDELIGICIQSGLPAVLAYRLASLNPAVYFGLDRELGGIAPGKWADINFLEDLERPTPIHVMARGKMWVKDGKLARPFPDLSLSVLHSEYPQWRITPEQFAFPKVEGTYPILELNNAVILLQKNEELPVENGKVTLEGRPGYLFAAQVDKFGKWITKGIVKGFGHFDALAASYTVSQDIMVLGRDPEQMAEAVNRVIQLNGGVVLMDQGVTEFELPLPLLGRMSDKHMDELIEETDRFVRIMRSKGYSHEDPLYSLLFFTSTHLPKVRFTREGIFDVKSGNILFPSEPIRQ